MKKTFVIAEAGVNHNGDENLALRLVETAARAGADAVKFQTFSAEKLVAPGAKKAEYQARETGDGDQYSMLKALELSEAVHRRIYERCSVLGIEFMSTPFDEDAADFLLALGMRRIKVPSGEITNEPFLEFLAAKGVPMILSTGMADLDEIRRAVAVVGAARERAGLEGSLADVLTILHCTSNYPAAYRDVNLRAMQTIAQETGLPVGYSDHTAGLAVSTAAVAMGATVIEKHFTLDRDLPGPDHKASLSPDELGALVRQIRDVDEALGSDEKCPTKSELPVRALVRRSVTTARPIQAGAVLGAADLALLRPGTGIAPADLARVVGRVACRDLPAGKTLQWTDLA
ncbi:N-acetylneuraminate synthase [Azospira restricta]|nr:N-acetylneuraminate synthase [Azospira restricta]